MFFKSLPSKVINVKQNYFFYLKNKHELHGKPCNFCTMLERAPGPAALACLPVTEGPNSASFLLSPQTCTVCSGTNSILWTSQL